MPVKIPAASPKSIARLQQAAKCAKDEGDMTQAEKIAADTARYEALAHEHGADLSEEGFNEVLRKVGRTK